MCTYICKSTTRKFLRRHKGKKFVKVWKILKILPGCGFGEDKLQSTMYPHVWKPGFSVIAKSATPQPREMCTWHCASMLTCDRTDWYRDVGKGYHVYLRKGVVYFSQYGKSFVVCLHGYLKDLIGVEDNYSVGVFRRLYLPKAEYMRVMKKSIC